MRPVPDSQKFATISGNTGGFTLDGGQYGIDVVGTVSSGGSVVLQKLGADGSSYVPVGNSVGSGGTPNYQTVSVPTGGFRVAVTSGTVSVNIGRVPTD